MNWGSWGTWGEYWALLCVGLAIAAVKSGDLEGWWIFLVLAAVAGYVGLNFLQARVEADGGDDEDEEGWRAACPYCDGAIVDKRQDVGEPDSPSPASDDPAVALTQVTRRITLLCEFDHKFDVEQTQQCQDRGFRLEWKGRVA